MSVSTRLDHFRRPLSTCDVNKAFDVVLGVEGGAGQVFVAGWVFRVGHHVAHLTVEVWVDRKVVKYQVFDSTNSEPENIKTLR